MTSLRLRYVHAFVDRHGRPRHYFRRQGRRIPLPGLPGSTEFNRAYEQALAGTPPAAEVGAARTVAGSVNAMIVGYLGSAAFMVQQKTGAPLPPIPIGADLAAAINAAAPTEHVVFLLNERGRSFTAKGFGQWFTKQCERIGLEGLSPHGLRKAACRRLAEPGCSANEIAALSGHKSLNEVARYTRAADQARMVRNAVMRMNQQHELANFDAGLPLPGEKGR